MVFFIIISKKNLKYYIKNFSIICYLGYKIIFFLSKVYMYIVKIIFIN